MNRSKNVTLKSLSKQLGLHVSTVSRVLNGTLDEAHTAASPETIEKIRNLATELNYQPNTLAKSLKTQKTQVISVLVPKLSDLVLATIYEGIDAAATQYNYFTFVSNTNDHPENQKKLGEMALSRKVDGLIIADTHINEQSSNSFLQELSSKEIPFILVSRKTENFISVTCNDYLGGELAAQHLISQGHRNIGVIAGEPFASTGIDRTQGFCDYCDKHGVTISNKQIIHSGFDVNSGHQAGLKLLSTTDKPTAIFAVNDFIAIGLMGAIKKLGMTPGKDIAVIGFNNITLAEQLPIPLTTIASPMYDMGYIAMELLIKRIKGEKIESIAMEPKLFIRESTLNFDKFTN
ncbi:LacI family transcriptional regulator [Acinetobacter populi]|uniref:LacI family transcriptional regulator n=2 Tax=Acinetobacter populi TaxID=1582270 RepID=A0A1Z9YZ67_9GAMM|nr:LacI family transcriptional regulator [Acinetobacter populi]